MNRRILTLIIIAATATALAGGLLADRAFRSILDAARQDILGVSLNIDSISIRWYTGSIVLKDVSISPAHSEDEDRLLARSDRLTLSLALHDLLFHHLHIRKAKLLRPTIHLKEESHHRSNWHAIALKDREALVGSWKISIDDVLVQDGTISYQDRKHAFSLRDARIELKNIVSESDPDALPTKLRVRGHVGETSGTIDVRGRINAFAPGINFDLDSTISDTPITEFRSFYAGQTPFPIAGGIITMTSSAEAKQSFLTATSHALIKNLKAGGGVSGKLINTFVLSLSGPINVTTTVKGNLEDGQFQVGSAISQNLGRAILAKAQEGVSPLSRTGDAVKRTGSSIGSGIKKLFK